MKGKKTKNYDEKRTNCSFTKYRRKKNLKKWKEIDSLNIFQKQSKIIFNINDLCL